LQFGAANAQQVAWPLSHLGVVFWKLFFFCAAVPAALTLPWSTGPVEGHIHRLKLIKRRRRTQQVPGKTRF